MSTAQKRIWTCAGMALLAVPLTVAAIAHACTGLATVNASPLAAVSGSTITVNGKGFVAHDPSDARTEPAKIRFDDLDGPVVATASPAPASGFGAFSVQIAVPNLPAGDHVLIVTQNGTDGRPAYGTPARQAFTIAAPAAVTPPVSPGGLVPALGEAFVIPALTNPSGDAAKLTKAVASCKKKFRASKARTKAGKRSMARKRSSCITSAEKKYG